MPRIRILLLTALVGCGSTRTHESEYYAVALSHDGRAVAGLVMDTHTKTTRPLVRDSAEDDLVDSHSKFLVVTIDPARGAIARRGEVGWGSDDYGQNENRVRLAGPPAWHGCCALQALDADGRVYFGPNGMDREIILGGAAGMIWDDNHHNELRLWEPRTGRRVVAPMPAADQKLERLSNDRSRLFLVRQASTGASEAKVIEVDLRQSLAAGVLRASERTVTFPRGEYETAWTVEDVSPTGRQLLVHTYGDKGWILVEVATGARRPILPELADEEASADPAKLPQMEDGEEPGSSGCGDSDRLDFLSDETMLLRRPYSTLALSVAKGGIEGLTKVSDECFWGADDCIDGWATLWADKRAAMVRCSDGKLLAAGIASYNYFFRAQRRAFAVGSLRGPDDQLLIFDLDAARVVPRPLPAGARRIVAISADARTVAFASWDSEENLLLYDVASGKVTTVKP